MLKQENVLFSIIKTSNDAYKSSGRTNMLTIPKQLYSKNIISYINVILNFDDVDNFDSLDDIHKDTLVALGIQSLNDDIELILNSDANHALSKLLISHDKDDQIDLIRLLKETAHEKFSHYFTEIIEEVKTYRKYS